MHVDSITGNLQRIAFARIYVEINAKQPLVDSFDLKIDDNEFVEIQAEYQWKPMQCNSCKTFGHFSTQCYKANAE